MKKCGRFYRNILQDYIFLERKHLSVDFQTSFCFQALVDCLAKCEKAKEMHEALSGDEATITDEIMAKIKTWLVEQITA